MREMCAVSTILSMLSTRYSAQTATPMVMSTRATAAAQGESIGSSFSWGSFAFMPSTPRFSSSVCSSSNNFAWVFSWNRR